MSDQHADDTDPVDAVAAAEYRNARERMQELASTLTDELAARTVPACPEWTVHDLFSHVTGIAADLSAGRRPDGGGTQAWVDRQIAERRSRPLADVVAEWSEAGPAFESMIDARPDRLWGLTYDIVVHEHDLRNAIDAPGERDSDGVRVALQLGLRIVETDLAGRGLPAFRVVADGAEYVVGEGTPELTLEATAFEALRLLGSRRTLDQLRAAAFTGDLDRYLPGLAHMELPHADLGE
jgi:uncharacterized protein (TIGR03083 family)